MKSSVLSVDQMDEWRLPLMSLGVFLFLLTGLLCSTQVSADEVMEEVVITGKKPGPPLWEVVNGDKKLYIFGSLVPLPESLEWDSERVEWVISQSDEFIQAPSMRTGTSNPFRLPGILKDLSQLKKLPKGHTLETVLPPDLYAAFLKEKERYAPRRNKLLTMRPSFAAEELSNRAFEGVGLSGQNKIPRWIEKRARKHDLTITEAAVDIPIDEALDMLKQVSPEADEACMRIVLTSIRTDLTAALTRAEAWMEGAVDLLKVQDYPDVGAACTQAMLSGPIARESRNKANDLWLEAAVKALEKNASTFSILPMREIFHPEGLLAQLKTRGYRISGAATGL